jgi:hypothetical protein
MTSTNGVYSEGVIPRTKCCFVLLIPTPEEYRVPRVTPGVTASKLFRLSAASGASTYPANRDFKGHVGGVRGAAPQGFFFPHIFEFFCYIFKEQKGDVLTNV